MPRERRDSYRGRRWVIPEPHELTPIPGTPYPDWLTSMLRRRGVADAGAARAFLFDAPPPAPDATQLPDIGPALDRIEQAVRRGEVIAVFGDSRPTRGDPDRRATPSRTARGASTRRRPRPTRRSCRTSARRWIGSSRRCGAAK